MLRKEIIIASLRGAEWELCGWVRRSNLRKNVLALRIASSAKSGIAMTLFRGQLFPDAAQRFRFDAEIGSNVMLWHALKNPGRFFKQLQVFFFSVFTSCIEQTLLRSRISLAMKHRYI